LKVAVIGNGPSGNNQGELIDACDFVVRIQLWKKTGPVAAGNKTNAVVGFNKNTIEFPDAPNTSFEVWCHIPFSLLPYKPGAYVDVNLLELIEFVSNPLVAFRFSPLWGCIKAIKYLEDNRVKPDRPYLSSGLATITMALSVLKPDELHIWGFDAMKAEGLVQYGSSVQDFGANSLHDYAAEKKMLTEFEDKGLWCGESINTKLIWHGRPEEAL
jgi:hypothetical protein